MAKVKTPRDEPVEIFRRDYPRGRPFRRLSLPPSTTASERLGSNIRPSGGVLSYRPCYMVPLSGPKCSGDTRLQKFVLVAARYLIARVIWFHSLGRNVVTASY